MKKSNKKFLLKEPKQKNCKKNKNMKKMKKVVEKMFKISSVTILANAVLP